MSINTSNIITEFVNKIDNDKKYNLSEIHKILTNAYNKINKERTPRPPSEYVKFIQNRMKEIKQDNPQQNAKEIMKTAASEWNMIKMNKGDDKKLKQTQLQ